MAPDEPSLSNELLDVAVNLSPPFSLSFRFDEDLLTNRLSLSLSDKRRLSRALFGPLPLLVAEAVGVEAVWGMLIGMSLAWAICGSNCWVNVGFPQEIEAWVAVSWFADWNFTILCKNECWSMVTLPELATIGDGLVPCEGDISICGVMNAELGWAECAFAWFAKCWCSFLDDENVIKGGIDDWVEDNGTLSQSAGWEICVDIDVAPVPGDCIRPPMGSLFEGERERGGVLDVAVRNAEGKGDLDVDINWPGVDDVKLFAATDVSCWSKAPMDVIGSDTDPDISIALGDGASWRIFFLAEPAAGSRDNGRSGLHFTVTSPVGSDRNHSDLCFIRSVCRWCTWIYQIVWKFNMKPYNKWCF